MILKKVITGILMLTFLSGCAQNTALLGPAYTLATSGNVLNAGLSYGGDRMVTKATGKSTAQNFKEALTLKNVDKDFEQLVKNNIKETRKKLANLSQ